MFCTHGNFESGVDGAFINFFLMTPVEIKKAVFIMPERKNKNAIPLLYSRKIIERNIRVLNGRYNVLILKIWPVIDYLMYLETRSLGRCDNHCVLWLSNYYLLHESGRHFPPIQSQKRPELSKVWLETEGGGAR